MSPPDPASPSGRDRGTVDSAVDWVTHHQAYLRCPSRGVEGWIDYDALALPVDDLGFRQGVTAVERIRTRQGQPFLLSRYLERLQRTLAHLQIPSPPPNDRLAELVSQTLQRNAAAWQPSGEVGITIWVTPGSVDDPTGRPTWAIHLNPIDAALVQRRRREGQPLVVTAVQQPPPESWSRQAKVRCRLHYYLADRAARTLDPEATGILLDNDGGLTETSTANIALVRGTQIVSPPASRVLPGVTQQYAQEVAAKLGLVWRHEVLEPAELRRADEILLMGTDVGLWFVNAVDGEPARGGDAHGVCRALQAFV